jgi:hypothetical protein
MEPATGRAGFEARGRRTSSSGMNVFDDFMSGFKDMGAFASLSALAHHHREPNPHIHFLFSPSSGHGPHLQ